MKSLFLSLSCSLFVFLLCKGYPNLNVFEILGIAFCFYLYIVGEKISEVLNFIVLVSYVITLIVELSSGEFRYSIIFGIIWVGFMLGYGVFRDTNTPIIVMNSITPYDVNVLSIEEREKMM